jgi:N-acetylglucosaminylphosphatidylinositol deacetylase
MVPIVPSLIHVLVTAHPDDESMFFLPWIYYTTRQQKYDASISSAVWLLCLTTGNFDGLGKMRSQELHDFNKYVLNNNGFQKVLLLDEPDIIPDHPKQRWNISGTAEQIHTKLNITLNEEYGPDSKRPCTLSFVTFDDRGVSGHVNHIDTYHAVQHLYHQQLQLLQSSSLNKASHQLLLANEVVEVWVLHTIRNPLRKYIPIVEWIRFVLHGTFGWYPNSEKQMIQKNGEAETSYGLFQPSLNWYAMSTHKSQFVWYRRLFVIFSIYTYKNIFHKLIPDDTTYTVNEKTISNTTWAAAFPMSQQQQQDNNTKKEL